jgi:hypothetical protein
MLCKVGVIVALSLKIAAQARKVDVYHPGIIQTFTLRRGRLECIQLALRNSSFNWSVWQLLLSRVAEYAPVRRCRRTSSRKAVVILNVVKII